MVSSTSVVEGQILYNFLNLKGVCLSGSAGSAGKPV